MECKVRPMCTIPHITPTLTAELTSAAVCKKTLNNMSQFGGRVSVKLVHCSPSTQYGTEAAMPKI